LESHVSVKSFQLGENYLSRPNENINQAVMNMRLDYTLYVLAIILFIITVIPFVAPIGGETPETQSVWVVASVVLGLLSLGLGYAQRPKTEAQACQPAISRTQETLPETQPVTTTRAPKEEQTEVPMEKPVMKETPTMATPTATTRELTHVKGIGEKRAAQLKALGINSVDELANASAKTVAKKLKISPKIVDKWISSAKEIVE
jgi:predicted flap endonuclease-1-like 5' DNA nuclease